MKVHRLEPSLISPSLDLNDTVTLLVGEDSVRIELPKAFLIQYSPFFKAAFDPTGRFSEASSKEMCLPDEDPRDILTLIRFLIETPKDLKHLITPHWPFICYEEQDDNTYCCDTWHWRTDRIPLMVRFCAMVERLGFDFPEERIWPVLEASVGSPGQPTMPIATPIIEWAMDHALDGYFKRYVALLLSQIVRSGATSLDTYLPILEKHAVLAIGMLQATYARKEGTKYQWDESTQGWSGNRYLWRWQH